MNTSTRHVVPRPSLSWRMEGEHPDDLTVRTTWPDAARSGPAWAGATGAGVRVCVVDSGVERDHPLIGPIEGAFTVAGTAEDRLEIVPDTEGDTYGHGTACASIIRRTAPECSVTSMRVLGGLFGSGHVLLAGLRWAVEQQFDVINLSLSTTKEQFSEVLHRLSDSAFFANSIVVASAHNMPVESFPWRFCSVISVGSHNEPDHSTYYANPSPPVEFFAPGNKIPVGWVGGGESVCTGNSFATPFISGLCALIRSRYPEARPYQVKSLLYLAAANVKGSS